MGTLTLNQRLDRIARRTPTAQIGVWLRGWPRLVGHIGVSAAHLWHDPETGSDIALNMGSTRAMVRSFRLLFGVVGALRKAG